MTDDKVIHFTGKTLGEGVVSVEYTSQNVVVCGVLINRPPSIAPSQWIDFWKHAQGRE